MRFFGPTIPGLLTTGMETVGSQERSILSLSFSNLEPTQAKLALRIDEAYESMCVTEKTRSRVG